jgi:hypothetical protein
MAAVVVTVIAAHGTTEAHVRNVATMTVHVTTTTHRVTTRPVRNVHRVTSRRVGATISSSADPGSSTS